MGHKKLAVASFILTLFLFNTMLVSSEEDEVGKSMCMLLIGLLLLLLMQFFFICVEDEKKFNYEDGGEIGPGHWGEIHKEWALCAKGKMQSPIDLSDDRVTVLPHLGLLRRSYRPAPAVLKNRGHDIMVKMMAMASSSSPLAHIFLCSIINRLDKFLQLKWEDDAGSIWINETKYSLKQLHWHSPSEHTVKGRRYSLEVHMVHESAEKQIAVVGILYTIGRSDSFLAEVSRILVYVHFHTSLFMF